MLRKLCLVLAVFTFGCAVANQEPNDEGTTAQAMTPAETQGGALQVGRLPENWQRATPAETLAATGDVGKLPEAWQRAAPAETLANAIDVGDMTLVVPPTHEATYGTPAWIAAIPTCGTGADGICRTR